MKKNNGPCILESVLMSSEEINVSGDAGQFQVCIVNSKRFQKQYFAGELIPLLFLLACLVLPSSRQQHSTKAWKILGNTVVIVPLNRTKLHKSDSVLFLKNLSGLKHPSVIWLHPAYIPNIHFCIYSTSVTHKRAARKTRPPFTVIFFQSPMFSSCRTTYVKNDWINKGTEDWVCFEKNEPLLIKQTYHLPASKLRMADFSG